MLQFKWKNTSSCEEPPAAQARERRREHRVSLFLRPTKLIVDGLEYLCILRDVSQGGLRLQLFHALPAGQNYMIELSNGTRCELRPAWNQGRSVGFATKNPMELGAFIQEVSSLDHRKRLRVNRSIHATLHADGATEPVLLKNISQQGALIETAFHIALDQLVRLEIDSLPAVYAKVRWRRGAHYGMIFEETFRLDKLATYLGPATPDRLP